MSCFVRVSNGRERWDAGVAVPRHRHDQAYAAIVLSGAYEECGSRGRFRVAAGDVLLHDAFDAHLDRFPCSGAKILNLIVDEWSPRFGIGHISDPDTIAQVAERDSDAAGILLRTQLMESKSDVGDWPDLLARDLLNDSDCCLDDWACRHGLAAETISRGFGKLFGVTPASFRAEVRARRAFAMITGGLLPLASIAAEAGFADQAHMSRAVRALTGSPPGSWRRSNPFKTDRAKAA